MDLVSSGNCLICRLRTLAATSLVLFALPRSDNQVSAFGREHHCMTTRVSLNGLVHRVHALSKHHVLESLCSSYTDTGAWLEWLSFEVQVWRSLELTRIHLEGLLLLPVHVLIDIVSLSWVVVLSIAVINFILIVFFVIVIAVELSGDVLLLRTWLEV